MVVVAVWRGIGIILVEPIGTLNVAKKSKRAKRGAPARRKKGMRAKKKPAPKPAPVPIAPSLPVWEGFGGMREGDASEEEKETGARAGSLAAAENSRRSIKSRQNQRHD